ncbi:MAG: hypothetical protein R2760_08030 [Chitinophagales bacterium]
MLVINKNNFFFGLFNKTKILIDRKRAATLSFNHSEEVLPAPVDFEGDITICVSNFEKTVRAKGNSTIIIQTNKTLQKLGYVSLGCIALLITIMNYSNSNLLYGFLIPPFIFMALIIYYALFKQSNMLDVKVIG